MAYVSIWTERLVQRLRNLINWRGEFIQPPVAMPVIQINDELVDTVICSTVERTSNGTSAIITVPSGRVNTYITGFTLTLSHAETGS